MLTRTDMGRVSRWAAIPVLAALLMAAGPRPSGAVFRFGAAFERLPSINSAARLWEADIDGDGLLDLMVVGSSSQVAMHRGLAGGGLGPTTPLLTAASVVRTATVGDLNNDGRPDLVYVDSNSNAWSVLNVGGGSFGSPRAVLSLFTGERIALADLDADGRQDLVAVGAFGPIIVMQGRGDGSFQLSGTIATPGGVWAIAFTDFDGDSRPDLLACYDSYGGSGDIHAVLFYHALPGLTFAAPVTCMTNVFGVQTIRTADLDRDGLMDAIVLRPGSASTVLFGAAGTAPNRPLNVAVSYASDVRALDFDSDGALDLAFTSTNDHGVVFMRAQPAGGYVRVADCATSDAPAGLVFADATGDGVPDVVASDPGTSTLVVVNGHGGFQFGGDFEVSVGVAAWSMTTGDLDRDGNQDIVVGTGWTPNPRPVTLLGHGDRTFGTPSFGPVTYPLEPLGLGDVNGDGKPDLVATASYSYEAYSLLGDGSGQFSVTSRTSFPMPWSPTDHFDLSLADFDEDGKDDAVFAVDGALARYLGSTSGALVSPTNLAATMKCVTTADLNRDGHVDVIATNSMIGGDFGSDIYVFLGRGDGSFTGLPSFYAGYKPSLLIARDVTRDGIPDLVVFNFGEGAIVVLRGAGNGTFTPASTITGVAPTSLELADCDGDGNLDLVFGAPARSSVAIMPGAGNGSFGTAEYFGCRQRPDRARCVDFDHDGLPEIVVLHRGQSKLTLLPNRGTGLPTPALVERVESHVDGTHVRLTWFGEELAREHFSVQRGSGGEWQEVGVPEAQGNGSLLFQEDVTPGEYDYRLVSAPGGEFVTAGLVHVVVAARTRFAIDSFMWDSKSSAFRLVAEWPGTSPVGVAVFDVSGRVVARQVLETSAAPDRPILVNCETPPFPGIYWVRVQQAGRATIARGAILR